MLEGPVRRAKQRHGEESARASSEPVGVLDWLRRHHLPIQAHFERSLVLTYAFPQDLLQPRLSPGLVLVEIVNEADKDGCLAVYRRDQSWRLTVGQTISIGSYQIYLESLYGFCIGPSYLAEGWIKKLA